MSTANSYSMPPTKPIEASLQLRNPANESATFDHLIPHPLNYYTDTLGLSLELSSKGVALESIFRITGVKSEFRNYKDMASHLKSEWGPSLYNRMMTLTDEEREELTDDFKQLGMRQNLTQANQNWVPNTDQQLVIMIASHPMKMWKQMQELRNWANPTIPLCKTAWLVASPRRYPLKDVLAAPEIKEYGQVSEILTRENTSTVTQAAIITAFFDTLFPKTSRHVIHLEHKDDYHNSGLLDYFTRQQGSLSGFTSVVLSCIQPFCPEAERIVRHFINPNAVSFRGFYSLYGGQRPARDDFVEYLYALKQFIKTDAALTAKRNR
ncbi:MAG: hypothetical protein ACR2PT_18535 [Endozoicomonas sp.]